MSIKFRDVFSAKYVLMIIGIFLIFVLIFIPDFEIKEAVFYTLILGLVIFAEFINFLRKVIICNQSITISPRFFDGVEHGENVVLWRKRWGLRFTIHFTIDNIKSVKILSSSEAKVLSPKKFRYLANGKNSILIEFINPLNIKLTGPIAGKKITRLLNNYPESISTIACSVKETSELYKLLNKKTI